MAEKIPLKGLYRDCQERIQPVGFARDVRNMVRSRSIGSYENEKGFELASSYLHDNNYQSIGLWPVLYNKIVSFSIRSDNSSEIGIFDANFNYTSIVNANLGFNINHPITIEYEYNFKGELIVAFTDNLNTPKILNFDSPPSPFSIPRIELFPSATEVKIDSNIIDNGGALLSGTYYPVFKYRNYDLSESGWSEIGNPIYVVPSTNNTDIDQYEGAKAGSLTSKALQFNLSNLDTNYDFVVLGIIYKQGGVNQTFELEQSIIGGSLVSIYLSDLSNGSAISITDITTPNAFYNRVKHLTQTNGILYGADVGESIPLALQKYANLIQLQFKSEEQNPLTLSTSYKVNAQNNKKKGFLHEEVYAFYIRFKLLKGGWTTAFHIPGRPPGTVEGRSYAQETDLNSSLITFDPTLQVDVTIDNTSKFYQTRDTSKNLNTTTRIGDLGFWQNENEFYPNTPDFDSSGIGGEDLRGKNVRHFRFPSIKKIKDVLYPSDSFYGITKMDSLSVVISSFPTIPSDILAQIEGYEIVYAKRNSANSTVSGQDCLMIGGKRRDDSGADNTKTTYTTGGNWQNISSGGFDPAKDTRNDILGNPYYLRFHSFDLLLNKPAIGASYISNQLHLVGTMGVMKADGGGTIAIVIDYGSTGASANALSTPSESLFAIKNYQYVPNNVISGKINNQRGETFASAELVYGNYALPMNNLVIDLSGGVGSIPGSEDSYLTNIMQYKKNIYNSFYSQPLASTGFYFLKTDSISGVSIYGGDTFICKYGFTTHGPRTVRDLAGSVDDAGQSDTTGLKIVRALLCESYNNIGFRDEVVGQQYSKYYPKEEVGVNSGWFLDYSLLQDWNLIDYNTDYSAINDLNAIVPFNPYSQFIDDHYNRIIRCIPSSNDQRTISWRTFKANDYFELQKNRGKISNIQGTGQDGFIYINTEFTLFRTVGVERLAVNELQVVLGSGDIFDRQPRESSDDKLGEAGCQNKFSCLLTSFGYFFVDNDRKKVFIANKEYVKDITEGLRNEFLNNMQSNGDNPFQDQGFTVAWDSEYKRILLTQLSNSYTYSYTPDNQSWTSQHDYIPSHLFNTRDNVFSLKNNKIYKHNSDTNRCIFYDPDIIYPCYLVNIEQFKVYQSVYNYQKNKMAKKVGVFYNISWRTDIILNGAKQRDLTIDKILLWNSYQCTDEMTLIPLDRSMSIQDNYGVYNTRREKDTWVFNKIRDLVIDNTQPFVVNSQLITSNIDVNRADVLKKHFADDYLAIKYLFLNKKISNLQPTMYLVEVDTNFNPISS